MELFETEVVGIERLREVGQYLYGPVVEIDGGLGPHSIGSVLHHEVHRGMVKQLSEEKETIFLHYPGIKARRTMHCEVKKEFFLLDLMIEKKK